MRRIIERTLKSLGVPDDKVDIRKVECSTMIPVLITIELSMSFFKELNKEADKSRFTYIVNSLDQNRLLINFFRR